MTGADTAASAEDRAFAESLVGQVRKPIDGYSDSDESGSSSSASSSGGSSSGGSGGSSEESEADEVERPVAADDEPAGKGGDEEDAEVDEGEEEDEVDVEGDGDDDGAVRVAPSPPGTSRSKGLPKTFFMGESSVTPEQLAKFEKYTWFDAGCGRVPVGDEMMPEGNEAVVFVAFFTGGLRIPSEASRPSLSVLVFNDDPYL